VAWNAKHAETEGGRPCIHPAWPTGQDTFERSLESKGVIDGSLLDGLLVPVQAESGVACQVAAKAGMLPFPQTVHGNGIKTCVPLIQCHVRISDDFYTDQPY
jgi:amidase